MSGSPPPNIEAMCHPTVQQLYGVQHDVLEYCCIAIFAIIGREILIYS